jgi:hypothetical protein
MPCQEWNGVGAAVACQEWMECERLWLARNGMKWERQRLARNEMEPERQMACQEWNRRSHDRKYVSHCGRQRLLSLTASATVAVSDCCH